MPETSPAGTGEARLPDNPKSVALKHYEGCYWAGRRYRYSYLKWDRIAYWLLLGAALASFFAGAALLTDVAKHHRWLSVLLGVLGIIAGLLQLLYSQTDARKRADDYVQGQRAYERMFARYERFLLEADGESAAARLRELLAEEQRLAFPRPMEGWTYKRIKKDIDAGERPAHPGARQYRI